MKDDNFLKTACCMHGTARARLSRGTKGSAFPRLSLFFSSPRVLVRTDDLFTQFSCPLHQCSFMAQSTFVCPCCIESEFRAPSEVLLLTHIRLVHSCDPNFSIQCSLDGCSRTFKNFRTFQNHRLLKHRHAVSEPAGPPNTEILNTGDFDELDNPESDHASLTPCLPSNSDVQSHAAKWILRTSELRGLTRAATLGIVQDTSDLVDFVAQSLRDQASLILSSNGVDSEVVQSITNIFNGYITRPFQGLTSFHQQLQYYRQHFNLIVSYFNLYN